MKTMLKPMTNASACASVAARAAAAVSPCQILQTFAGQQREIGRNERKDARRYEGNEAREEGDAHRDVRRRGHAPKVIILPFE